MTLSSAYIELFRRREMSRNRFINLLYKFVYQLISFLQNADLFNISSHKLIVFLVTTTLRYTNGTFIQVTHANSSA